MDNHNDILIHYINTNKTEWEALRESSSKLLQVYSAYQKGALELLTRNLSDTLGEFSAEMMQVSMEAMKDEERYRALLESIKSAAFSTVDYGVISENWKTLLLESYKKKVDYTEYYSRIYSYYIKIFSDIQSIPEVEIESILCGTEYTRADVLKDIENFKKEVPETLEVGRVNTLPEEKVNEHLRKYPALAYILFVFNLILFVISSGQTMNETAIPWIQNAIVAVQGYENILFVDVDSAKLYSEPSSHSVIKMNILYGEQVTLIESVKLWDKVIYTNPDGEEVEGWIAKRNLMTYQDYEFNSEDLYNIE